MLLPSEIEARWLLPVLRALIVRRLLNEYHMTQEKVAEASGDNAGERQQLREGRQGKGPEA